MNEATKVDTRGKWYAIRVHTGFEFVVEENIRQLMEAQPLSDKVFQVLVPTETQIKIQKGKRLEKQEKIYPGFVLINMTMDTEVWYVINNIDRVNSFVGSRSNAETITESEMQKIFARINRDVTKIDVDVKIDDLVRIVNGPFSRLQGKVREVDATKGQLVVSIPMFGRETPVKLHLFQIKKLT